MNRLLITFLIAWLLPMAALAAPRAKSTPIGRPDLAAIKAATNDPDSPFYYNKLLKAFQSPDTSMTSEEFQYLYYGTLYRDDYDPYRQPAYPGELEALGNILSKPEPNRSDRNRILEYARKALQDNPMDLEQINNLIYVYERNGKLDHARIWQYKLNHLLKVIARSGTGADSQNAWIVIYPTHEYFFLNLNNIVATGHRFEAPNDIVEGRAVDKKDGPTQLYYFNIEPMLEQYYLKHPDEEQFIDE